MVNNTSNIERKGYISNLNPIFRLIHSFKGNKNDSNKKWTSKNTSPSCVVAGVGFIPPRCSGMGQ